MEKKLLIHKENYGIHFNKKILEFDKSQIGFKCYTSRKVVHVVDQGFQIPRWNIFACELEDILLSRDASWTWGHLRYHANLHQQKVERLRESLIVLESFPVLNPKEIDRVISAYSLGEKEVLRLRLAILCAGIERMLMSRIPGNEIIEELQALEADRPYSDSSLRKALKIRQAISVLLTTLLDVSGKQENTEDSVAYALTDVASILKRGDNSQTTQGAIAELLIVPALKAIDEATIALHLSKNLSANADRITYLLLAQHGFQTALIELNELQDVLERQDRETWQVWYGEAEKGLEEVEELLEDLGAN
jgi:hypothetical protein